MIDMQFRIAREGKFDNKTITHCLCPFGSKVETLRCVFSNEVKDAFLMSCKCKTVNKVKTVFKDQNALLQHCDGSRDWNHDMISFFIRIYIP